MSGRNYNIKHSFRRAICALVMVPVSVCITVDIQNGGKHSREEVVSEGNGADGESRKEGREEEECC